eukprot:TRINITY_DN5757_c0_g2_i8.p1 TRINITY_DN5757_c0_g2~~TRINITY_DN5757_c0_g2_i8.p1  ORF type:complete len:727 (-),score=130.86 TRINITY_DN5757_c0_g2_i8:261-2324(-)
MEFNYCVVIRRVDTHSTSTSTCKSTQSSRIVQENCLPGNPSIEWDINDDGDPTIQGFTHAFSLNAGSTVHFKVNTSSTNYRIDIYRMGYYGGHGARKVTTVNPSVELPQIQPTCFFDSASTFFDCGNWMISASWDIPVHSVSGIYFGRMVRMDLQEENCQNNSVEPSSQNVKEVISQNGKKIPNSLKEPHASHAYFVVRNDDSTDEIVFQTSDTTWQVHNSFGNTNPDLNPNNTRCTYKLSYNRPFNTRRHADGNMLWISEYPTIRFLEKNGYSITYISGFDTDRYGYKIHAKHRLFLTLSHKQYWSERQKKNIEEARDAGVHLAFLNGNLFRRKIHWEDSKTDEIAAQRTLVVYKDIPECLKNLGQPDSWKEDEKSKKALETLQKEITEGPSEVCPRSPLVIPYKFRQLRFWRNTDVSTLNPGEEAITSTGILGHEWSENTDTIKSSASLHLSETIIENVRFVHRNGHASGTGIHHLSLSKAASGSLMFASAEAQWSWGLDNHHDIPRGSCEKSTARIGVDLSGPDLAIQQATVNLLADMNCQPVSLSPHLVKATASTDMIPPTSRILPTTFGPVQMGEKIVVGAEATDTGGGVVALMELSTDYGDTWDTMTWLGGDKWSYQFNVKSIFIDLQVRATDDSCNTENPYKKDVTHIPVLHENPLQHSESHQGTETAKPQHETRDKPDL